MMFKTFTDFSVPAEINGDCGKMEVSASLSIQESYYGTKVDDVKDFNPTELKDNDRYIIGLVVKPKECNGCEYTFETCEVTCEHNIRKGKTRAEYEDMIAESIYNHTISIYKNSYNGLNPNELEKIEEESKELAKAVVDRLFGEGE